MERPTAQANKQPTVVREPPAQPCAIKHTSLLPVYRPSTCFSESQSCNRTVKNPTIQQTRATQPSAPGSLKHLILEGIPAHLRCSSTIRISLCAALVCLLPTISQPSTRPVQHRALCATTVGGRPTAIGGQGLRSSPRPPLKRAQKSGRTGGACHALVLAFSHARSCPVFVAHVTHTRTPAGCWPLAAGCR